MMNEKQAEQVLLLTLANDGGTFEPDGTPYVAFEGYSVAIVLPSESVKVSIDAPKAELVEEIRLASNHWKLYGGRKLGTWIDDDNVINIDVVKVVDDLNVAMSLGILWEQQAIWSFESSEAIFI